MDWKRLEQGVLNSDLIALSNFDNDIFTVVNIIGILRISITKNNNEKDSTMAVFFGVVTLLLK